MDEPLSALEAVRWGRKEWALSELRMDGLKLRRRQTVQSSLYWEFSGKAVRDDSRIQKPSGSLAEVCIPKASIHK